jgi:hypothetical protein
MSEYTYTHVGRNDLGGVGGGESLEDTPGDTADTDISVLSPDPVHVRTCYRPGAWVNWRRTPEWRLAISHDMKQRKRVKRTRKSHDHHSDHVGLSRPILALSPTVNQETKDLATFRSVVDTGLPVGRDILASVRCGVPKVVDISVESKEIVDLLINRWTRTWGRDLRVQCPYPPWPMLPRATWTR